MERIKYIRTDKNGTKIYEDWTCPRCGGQGWAGQWKFTGVTCFRCGGSGLRKRPVIVKEYTDEYWQKLNARREAKAAKYAEEHADEIAAGEYPIENMLLEVDNTPLQGDEAEEIVSMIYYPLCGEPICGDE